MSLRPWLVKGLAVLSISVCLHLCVFISGSVEDILLVPVGISYDSLIERQFIRHELMVSTVGVVCCNLQECNVCFFMHSPVAHPFLPCSSFSYTYGGVCVQGGSKKVETFINAMYGLWAMLTRNTGSVRIDFSQPFSLQVSTWIAHLCMHIHYMCSACVCFHNNSCVTLWCMWCCHRNHSQPLHHSFQCSRDVVLNNPITCHFLPLTHSLFPPPPLLSLPLPLLSLSLL